MKTEVKKMAGYRLYGLLYRIFSLLPVDGNRAYFVMTHDSSGEGNCGVMKEKLEARGYRCDALTRAEAAGVGFIFRSAYRLARSRFIFLDNTFLPLSCLRLRKGSTLTQLWHGTGTIKKFGQDVTIGRLKDLEARCGRNISHLIVSSPATKSIYAGCFGVPEDRVRVLGLPRSDAFFAPGFAEAARARFEEKYPAAKGRRLVLYAPTFRDDEDNEDEQIRMIGDFARDFAARMPKDSILGLRLHPYVSSRLAGNPGFCADVSVPGSTGTSSRELSNGIASPAAAKTRILDLTHFSGLNTLLGAADVLITDYSSIIFEYSLLRRPMYFYAYDLGRFEGSDRGFYRDYRGYVPGPVYTRREELLDALSATLRSGRTTVSETTGAYGSFLADSFSYTDGRSAERIMELLGV
ncbi:MAG: CDP-glycerol glycerophosphotransferase family protein [Lachnospiraceae bacterium]|nr:CDP-glycerol glycerophosphotransferase family protein [Lachnospiraceae bacterium]